jgi:hypothetical protein
MPATERFAPTSAATELLDATSVLPVGATELLPGAAPATATTSRVAPSAPVTPPASVARRRTGPSPWLIVVVLALVAVAVGLVIVLFDGPQSPLPAVDGELGEHLRQLRESIRS